MVVNEGAIRKDLLLRKLHVVEADMTFTRADLEHTAGKINETGQRLRMRQSRARKECSSHEWINQKLQGA